jgi:hypothetical protein
MIELAYRFESTWKLKSIHVYDCIYHLLYLMHAVSTLLCYRQPIGRYHRRMYDECGT